MTDFNWAQTDDVLHEVHAERERQHGIFGDQDLPDTAQYSHPRSTEYATTADTWKANNASRILNDRLAWDGLLLEEVYEALAESDPAALRTELIQVAALAVAWVEAIDRRETRARRRRQMKAFEEWRELTEDDE